MTREEYAFTDMVSGKRVHYWYDRKGRCWMKESRWSFFKVRCERKDKS